MLGSVIWCVISAVSGSRMEARASLLYSLSVAEIQEMGEILVDCGLG